MTGLWPVLPGGDARRSIVRFVDARDTCLGRKQHRHLHQSRRIPRRRHILARNPLLPHHPAQQRLCHPRRPAQSLFSHALPLRQIIEHAKFDQLLFRRALRLRRRPRHPGQMQRHPSLIGDAILDRAFKLGGERQHGAKHLAGRREIVIGNPLPKFQQLFIENRREVERFDNFLDLLSLNLRRTVMQLNHDARHALLPERHQHASANDRLRARRHGVGEHHVERDGEGDVAEEGHVLGTDEILSYFRSTLRKGTNHGQIEEGVCGPSGRNSQDRVHGANGIECL